MLEPKRLRTRTRRQAQTQTQTQIRVGSSVGEVARARRRRRTNAHTGNGVDGPQQAAHAPGAVRRRGHGSGPARLLTIGARHSARQRHADPWPCGPTRLGLHRMSGAAAELAAHVRATVELPQWERLCALRDRGTEELRPMQLLSSDWDATAPGLHMAIAGRGVGTEQRCGPQARRIDIVRLVRDVSPRWVRKAVTERLTKVPLGDASESEQRTDAATFAGFASVRMGPQWAVPPLRAPFHVWCNSSHARFRARLMLIWVRNSAGPLGSPGQAHVVMRAYRVARRCRPRYVLADFRRIGESGDVASHSSSRWHTTPPACPD